MSKLLKTTLLALTASLAVSTAAQASNYGGIKDFSFSIQDSPLGDPLTFVYVPKNGKYRFTEIGGSPVQLRIKGKKYRRAHITRYSIYLGHPHNGGKKILSHGFMEGSWKKIDKRISFNDRKLLKAYEAKGLEYCRQHGNPNNRVMKDMDIMFTGWMASKGKNHSQRPKTASTHKATRYATSRIVCMPEPFVVNDVKLSIKRNGSMTSCPANITLRAQFKTNKAGKFKFRLFRGDGAFRDVEMTASSSGRATYTQKYTFNKTTHRKYYAAVIGGTQASSQWTPMSVNCSQPVGGGSFSTGPGPSLE